MCLVLVSSESFAGACHTSCLLTHPSTQSPVYPNTFITVTQRKREEEGERKMWATQQCSAHLLNDKQNNATTPTNLTHKIKDTGKNTTADREQGEAMKERAFVLAYKEEKNFLVQMC